MLPSPLYIETNFLSCTPTFWRVLDEFRLRGQSTCPDIAKNNELNYGNGVQLADL